MNKEVLIMYEMPSIAEFISFGPLQTVIGKYVAWKITKKLNRLERRKKMKIMVERYRGMY